MTKIIVPKKVARNKMLQFVYKTSIIIYSLYITFSAQVFALEAEAPLGSQSFQNLIFDETAALERKAREDAEKLRLERIAKIESYFGRHDLPLQDEAQHFVDAAEEYNIDWRLVAAIGFIESTGGKFSCKTAEYSAFGWGSCKIDFDSYKESIDVISWNLGGHNPNTDHWYYQGQDHKELLETYNPPHVRPDYAFLVMREMDIIDAQ
ncbi:MAG: hypothetical protein MRY57_02720 [Candidatus Pacebacteria bacterium]|nr:hypothetical protein [Candidatus Paceibacterota bacterium]